MKRIALLLFAPALLMSLCACHPRIDLSADPVDDGSNPTAVAPGDTDEMAAHAWDIYEKVLEKEENLLSYELVYESRINQLGQVSVTKARMVQVTHEDGKKELLVEVQHGSGEESGYFKDGVAYFQKDGKKYWIPTDEEAFLSELGFSEAPKLSEEMFTEAIAVNNPDGTVTVSCPLSGRYAADYVRMKLGDSMVGGEIQCAEESVTADADGNPLSFQSVAWVKLPLYGEAKAESTNRYVSKGADVVLTPPADLETYTSIVGK